MATITRTIALKSAEGDNVFPVKELDFFNLVCDLEGQGIDVMTLTEGGLDRNKLFTTLRALLSTLINVTPEEAGKLMTEHLANGGAIDTVFEVFTDAMTDAGFGKRPQTPQDHKKPTAPKSRRTAKK